MNQINAMPAETIPHRDNAALIEFFQSPRDSYTAREIAQIEGLDDEFLKTTRWLQSIGDLVPIPGMRPRRFAREDVERYLIFSSVNRSPEGIMTILLTSGDDRSMRIPAELLVRYLLHLQRLHEAERYCDHRFFGEEVHGSRSCRYCHFLTRCHHHALLQTERYPFMDTEEERQPKSFCPYCLESPAIDPHLARKRPIGEIRDSLKKNLLSHVELVVDSYLRS